jgi:hypothetical protein
MASVEALEQKIRELEVRLRGVEDVEAIRRLKARYGQLADSRYARGRPRPREELEPIARALAGLFSEDAIWDGGPVMGLAEGRDAIYERFLQPTLNFSWHYFVKPHIVVDGDTASATWDILAPCTSAADEAMWMAGFEEDRYVRVDGAWLHSEMKLGVVFMAPHAKGWVRPPRRP